MPNPFDRPPLYHSSPQKEKKKYIYNLINGSSSPNEEKLRVPRQYNHMLRARFNKRPEKSWETEKSLQWTRVVRTSWCTRAQSTTIVIIDMCASRFGPREDHIAKNVCEKMFTQAVDIIFHPSSLGRPKKKHNQNPIQTMAIASTVDVRNAGHEQEN